MAIPLCFVTGSSSHNALNGGPERIPVRYVVTKALAVEQVQKRVASFNHGVLLLKCGMCPESFQRTSRLLKLYDKSPTVDADIRGVIHV
jgi:hypothetical protein